MLSQEGAASISLEKISSIEMVRSEFTGCFIVEQNNVRRPAATGQGAVILSPFRGANGQRQACRV
jgi:hypothetical protein